MRMGQGMGLRDYAEQVSPHSQRALLVGENRVLFKDLRTSHHLGQGASCCLPRPALLARAPFCQGARGWPGTGPGVLANDTGGLRATPPGFFSRCYNQGRISQSALNVLRGHDSK